MMASRPPTAAPAPKPVRIFADPERFVDGTAWVNDWSKGERIRRGVAVSARKILPIMALPLPLALLEPFLFLIWGSVFYALLVTLAGPFLFAKYWAEESSFTRVDAPCPHCSGSGPLVPYVHTEYAPEFTVLCRECGQTSRASPRGEA